MALLRIEFNSTSIQEGAGDFVATFSLVEEAGDPVVPDHEFEWFINIGTIAPFAIPALDYNPPNGLSGTISFSDYIDNDPGASETLTFATPFADGQVEGNENFNLSVRNFQGSTTLSLEAGSSASNPLIIEDECFLAGTNILTEHGYRRIEDLKIGDKVKTFDGKLEEIKWIGKQTRHRFTAHPLRSLPIQIKAGALGHNLPHRDLFVSPDHSILIEGVLINAGAIENGVSIVKTYPEKYVYYHIELENHTLLDAEGVAAESFLPNREDRSLYDNGIEYEKLYPDGTNLMLWPMDYPRISSQNKVPRYISKKLLEIANHLSETENIYTA